MIKPALYRVLEHAVCAGKGETLNSEHFVWPQPRKFSFR